MAAVEADDAAVEVVIVVLQLRDGEDLFLGDLAGGDLGQREELGLGLRGGVIPQRAVHRSIRKDLKRAGVDGIAADVHVQPLEDLLRIFLAEAVAVEIHAAVEVDVVVLITGKELPGAVRKRDRFAEALLLRVDGQKAYAVFPFVHHGDAPVGQLEQTVEIVFSADGVGDAAVGGDGHDVHVLCDQQVAVGIDGGIIAVEVAVGLVKIDVGKAQLRAVGGKDHDLVGLLVLVVLPLIVGVELVLGPVEPVGVVLDQGDQVAVGRYLRPLQG